MFGHPMENLAEIDQQNSWAQRDQI